MTRILANLVLSAALAGLCVCCSGGGDPPVTTELQRLQASDAGSGACFGYSVAIDGSTALVGACFDSEAAHDAGAVYRLEKIGSTWVQSQKLTAYNPTENAHFGTSVALEGALAVAGAPGAAGGWGAAYPLVAGTPWVVRTSYPMGGFADPSLRMGWSVSMSGRMVLVGIPRAPDMGGDPARAGMLQFFELAADGSSWNEGPWTWASDPAADADLGTAVAIDGGKAAAGAPGIGAVYAYAGGADPDQWIEAQRLESPDGAQVEGYGISVALQGNMLVVGSLLERCVYVYGWTGTAWTRAQTLRAWDGMEDSYFGFAVALDGDALIVGAPAHSKPLRRCGTAYVFRHRGGAWVGSRKLMPTTPLEDGAFGASVAVSGDDVAVGAVNDGAAGSEVGAVYFYDLALPAR